MTEPKTTVVGVFDDYNTAERVAQDLTNIGIPRTSIQLQSNFRTGAAGRSSTDDEPHEGGIAGFFHRLFGTHHEHTEHYAEAVRRGNAVVCVTASPDRLDRAVEVMNANGAVDIDRRVAGYRETGYERHDPQAPAYSYEEAARERERYREINDSTSVPVVEEALDEEARAIRRGRVRVYYDATDQAIADDLDRRPAPRRDSLAEADPVGTTPRESVLPKPSRTARTTGKEYTPDFRRDYDVRFANQGIPYDTVAPAYDYGYRCASDPRYQSRKWEDAEEELKTDYLRNNPDSSWDRVRGAVRYGWEKMTGKR